MKELATLAAVIIVLFIAFVIFWNRKWQGKILDEREVHIRLKVRELVSRAVEIALVASIGFHLFIQPLSALQVFIIVGAPGIVTEAFANWWLRREAHEA